MATKTNTEAPAPAPAPAMPAPSLLDRYGSDVVLDPVTPLVDREYLRQGTLVRYLKAEPIQREGKNRWNKHHFLAHDDRRFGVGGTAELDKKLRLVRPGAVLFLRYDGQDAENTHQWKVTRIECTAAQLTALKESPELKQPLVDFMSVLDAAYEKEEARQAEFRERRQGGQQPPPHDDEHYTG